MICVVKNIYCLYLIIDRQQKAGEKGQALFHQLISDFFDISVAQW
jgi:hypothetical protein